MKKLTIAITLMAMATGIGIMCVNLLDPLVGLVFGLIAVAPLFVTLVMSALLVGTGTQIALLSSNALYVSNAIYLRYLNLSGEDHFNILALANAIPIMIVLWFIAAVLSKTRAEQAEVAKVP